MGCGHHRVWLVVALPLAALALAMSAGAEDAKALYGAGLEAERAGRTAEAAECFARALELARAAPDSAWQQAACLEALGRVRGRLGDARREIELTAQAQALYRTTPGTEWEQANCLAQLGGAWGRLGDDRREEDLTREALALYRAGEGTEWEQANCLLALGVVAGEAGRHQEEVELLGQALDIYLALEDAVAEQAACLQNLGVTYGRLGDHDAKVRLTREALALYRRLPGTERHQAQCLQNLGSAHFAQEAYGEAARVTAEALALYRALPGTLPDQARCLTNLAAAHGALGETEREIEMHRRALGIYGDMIGMERERAGCLVNLGVALLIAGEHEAGLWRLAQAERLLRRLAREAPVSAYRVPEDLYKAEMGIGKAYRLRNGEGDLCRAYMHYARAVRLVEHLRGRAADAAHLKASYFAQMVWAYDETISLLVEMHERGVPLEAAAMRERRPVFWRDLGLAAPDLWEGWGSYEEAILHYSEGARARVLRDLLAAGPRGAPLGGQDEWAELSALMGREEQLAQRLQDAATAGEQARVEALRAEREDLARRRSRAQLSWERTAFGRLADPRPASLESIRRRLRDGQALVEYKLLSDRVVACVVTRRGLRMAQVGTRPGEERGIMAAPVEAVVGQEALGRLRAAGEETGRRMGLPPGVAAPVRSQVLRRVFSPAELVWLYRRPMALLGGDSEVGHLEALGAREQQAHIAAALYDLLLRPVEDALDAEDVRELIIVPDGALYYLPFGALISRLPAEAGDAAAGQVYAAPGVEFAVERWAISQVPSMTMLLAVEDLAAGRPPPSRRLVAFADPVFSAADERVTRPAGVGIGPGRVRKAETGMGEMTALPRLVHTRREADRALAAFSGEGRAGDVYERPEQVSWGHNVALVSLAAAEPFLHEPRLADYGHVLISTHGIIRPEEAFHSYLAFTAPEALGAVAHPASDGRLLLPEAFGLRLNARMVTLSACRTAEGSYARGEGIISLSAAFFVAGARGLTASLWAVADEATADLIGGYHESLAAGQAPAEALRGAQVEMLARARAAYREDPAGPAARLAHPYYWAPFILMGR